MSKPRDSAQRLTDRQRAALRTLAAETGPPPGHSTLAAHCVPGGKRVLWQLERAGSDGMNCDNDRREASRGADGSNPAGST